MATEPRQAIKNTFAIIARLINNVNEKIADDKLAKSSNLSDLAERQTALNNLVDAAGGTNEHVLTKDTATGNIILKAAAGGGGGGGGGVLVEEIAMPTSGWAADLTYTDFQSVDVVITETISANDDLRFDPLLTSLIDRNSWINMSLARVERINNNTIRLYALIANTVAFNCELKIIKFL